MAVLWRAVGTIAPIHIYGGPWMKGAASPAMRFRPLINRQDSVINATLRKSAIHEGGDAAQVLVPEEVTNASMEVKPELLLNRFIIEREVVCLAPATHESQVEIGVRSTEDLPTHLNRAVGWYLSRGWD
jgi:hypothetical protein